jgi:hypothetical protein
MSLKDIRAGLNYGPQSYADGGPVEEHQVPTEAQLDWFFEHPDEPYQPEPQATFDPLKTSPEPTVQEPEAMPDAPDPEPFDDAPPPDVAIDTGPAEPEAPIVNDNAGPDESAADAALASKQETIDAAKMIQEQRMPEAPAEAAPTVVSGGKSDNLELINQYMKDKLQKQPPPELEPPPGPSKEEIENKHKDKWVLQALAGRLAESGGKGLGNMARGIGNVLGTGAKAIGNMGAALNTAGYQQQSKFGNAPGAAAASLMQGLGDTGAVGMSALGNMVGGSLEDTLGAIGGSERDYAAHEELKVIQEEMYAELQRQIQWANKNGVPLDRAGIYEAWKNIENSAANVMTSLNRGRIADTESRR